MQKGSSKLVTVGGIIILILVGYLGWSWFGATSSTDVGSVLSSSSGNSSSPEVQDLLNFLSELRTIKIDTSIFSNPAFLSLQDDSVQLVPQTLGRKNPFAPLP